MILIAALLVLSALASAATWVKDGRGWYLLWCFVSVTLLLLLI